MPWESVPERDTNYPPLVKDPEADDWHQTSCPNCKTVCLTAVRRSDVDRWRGGELIQDVWPDWSAAKRERFVTGYCPACFDRIFAEPSD